MYFYMCIRICVVTVWPKAEHPWILCTFDNQPCQRFWPLLLLEKVTGQPNVNGKYSTTTGGTMSIFHNINGVWSVLSVTQCEVKVFGRWLCNWKRAPRSQPKLSYLQFWVVRLIVRLVGGLEHEFYFSRYWESSSQLTFIFFRGVETTNQ